MHGAVLLSLASILPLIQLSMGADLPVTAPDRPLPVLDPTFVPEEPEPTILYINFDGGQMINCGNDDPHQNCSTIFQGTVYPYSGDEAKRAAIVQHVEVDLEPFAVDVVTERPPLEVDYDMEMVGDWDQSVYGFAGVAPHIDCGNAFGGATSFSLEYSELELDIAKVILQEVAHTWGLEHVESKGDLLYPKTSGDPDPMFEDACYGITKLDAWGIVKPDIAVCPAQHMASCGDPNQQNSHAELLTILGPGFVDTTPPTVLIESPTEGDVVESMLVLEAQIDDDVVDQTFTVRVDVDGEGMDVEWDGPGLFSVPVSGLADGEHTLAVIATDLAGNVSSDEVTVQVGEPPAPEEPDTGDSDDGDDGGSTGDGPWPPGGDEDPGSSDDGGCGCATTPGSPVGALALVLLAGVRRRR